MNLEKFLDKTNKKYQIKVIAPTFTYGTMYSLDSQFDFEIDFDEYDKNDQWEFNVVVDGEVIATFNTVEDTKEYIESTIFLDFEK